MPSHDSGAGPKNEAFQAFFRGHPGIDPAAFNEEGFATHRHAALFLAGSVFLDHFKSLYRLFDGDLVMALVMAEIWRFNLGRYFARAGVADATSRLSDDDVRRDELPGCNAYSISQTLGVPSETVRRKVRKLIAAGLIENGHLGGLITTRKLDDLFPAEMIRHDVSHLVAAGQMISALLAPR